MLISAVPSFRQSFPESKQFQFGAAKPVEQFLKFGSVESRGQVEVSLCVRAGEDTGKSHATHMHVRICVLALDFNTQCLSLLAPLHVRVCRGRAVSCGL